MDHKELWPAMRALAKKFDFEERPRQDAGVILDPLYGDQLTYAVLQLREDGLLTLGLQNGRLIVEAMPAV